MFFAKAPPLWQAKEAPFYYTMDTIPEFTNMFYIRLFDAWFKSPGRRSSALDERDLNLVIGALSTQAPIQVGPRPPYHKQVGIEGRTPAKHHFFIFVDLPPCKPMESLTPAQRTHVPRELPLYEKLFASLLRPPFDGEQGFFPFMFTLSTAFIEECTVYAQSWQQLSDPIAQSNLRVISAMGHALSWWIAHRRMTVMDREVTPNLEAERAKVLFQTNVQPRSYSAKEAYVTYSEMKLLKARLESQSLLSYLMVLLPWINERAYPLYQYEIAVREDLEETVMYNGVDPGINSANTSSLLIRNAMYKLSRDNKDDDFTEWISDHQIAEYLAPLPAYYAKFPNQAQPPLAGGTTQTELFKESVKRVFLMLRCYEKFSNYTDLVEIVNDELRIAYAYHWDEGESLAEWVRRLIRQVQAPALTIDQALLVEEQHRGLVRCINGFFTVITEQVERPRMRELYRHLVLTCSVYQGQPSLIERNQNAAMSELMARAVTTSNKFREVLTHTVNWMRANGILQQPLYQTKRAEHTRRQPKARFKELNALGEGTEDAAPETDSSPAPTLTNDAVLAAVQSAVVPAVSQTMSPSLQLIHSAFERLNAQLGSHASRLDDHSKQLQLHHEQKNHEGNRGLHAVDAEGSPDGASTLLALQQSYPPRRDGGSWGGGPSQGRGGNPSGGGQFRGKGNPPVPPHQIASLPMADRPWPFKYAITDFHDLLPTERAKMMKATGITGADHPHWTTTNVLELPGKKCGCCGSEDHTNGWCGPMWRQTMKVIKEKGDYYSEQGRKRLLWNRPTEGQLAALSEHMADHDEPDARVSAIVHDSRLSDFVQDCQPLSDACAATHEDGGQSLCLLIQEWEDPRELA